MAAEHADMIAEFCSITDAVPSVAESFLAAHNFNLERSLDTFFRDEPAARALQTYTDIGPSHPVAMDAAGPDDDDYVEVVDDDDDETGGAGIAELARQRASALAARQEAEAAQDEAAAAGMSEGDAAGAVARPTQPTAAMAATHPANMADEDLAAVAAAMASAEDDGAPADVASYHRRQQEELLAMYQQRAAWQHSPPLHPAAGAAADDDDLAVGGEAATAAAAAAGSRAVPDEQLDLPEGINIEEARMLEAAMLGVPYEGRIPDFTASAAAAAPLSPTTLEQHAIRREQDQAYEESLALDRAKQESIAAAAAQAEAEECAQREAEAEAAAAAVHAAEELQQLLAAKQARLPPEPEPGTPGSLSVVVRLPEGRRTGRRFLASDPLQALFDYVDTQCAAAGDAGVAPGSYRLVTQFPRRVLTEGSSSLQDAGISTDTALFLELL